MEHQKIDDIKALFSAWVSDPSGIELVDSNEIESMSGAFPYCQILKSLRPKALKNQGDTVFRSALAKAAVYSPKRRVLYSLLNQPEHLRPVTALIVQAETYHEVLEEDDYEYSAHPLAEELENPELPEPVVTLDSAYENQVPVEQVSDPPATEEPAFTHLEGKGPGLQKEVLEYTSMDEEGKMILENIASADFFAFEEKLDLTPADTEADDHPHEINSPEEAPVKYPQANLVIGESETKDVARYDDESMPYSFLWWLHKTRQEHADTYQPYVDFKLDTTQKIKKRSGEELNQQIIENIFHLQSPLDEMDNKALPNTVPFELKRKEEEIIEKFIREEPQIHPPSPDKLDMENKARKSAEDPNDLVSETLATIYTEQMLFHKAIDTYQKLSLKFPGKKSLLCRPNF